MDTDSISHSLIQEQIRKPMQYDFVRTVEKDLKECGLQMSFYEFQMYSKSKFKEIERKACARACFSKLMSEKENLSKGKYLNYHESKMQNYLLPENKLDIHSMRKIMHMRLRDTNVRSNFPSSFSSTICPSSTPGCKDEESQQHVFICSYLTQYSTDMNCIIPNGFSYDDLYGRNVLKQYQVMEIFYNRLHVRDALSHCE